MDIHKFIGKVYGKRLSAKLTGILLLAVIAAITQFLSAFYLGRITDSISLGKETVIARTIVIAMIVLINFVSCFGLDFFTQKMSNRLANLLHKKCVQKICKADYRKLSDMKDGDLLTIATSDIEEITEWFLFLIAMVQGPIKIIIVFVAMIKTHWILFIASVVLYPLILLPSLLLSKKIYYLNKREKEAIANNTNFIKETLSFMVVLKSFCFEKLFLDKSHCHLKELEQARREKQKRDQLIQALPRLAGSLVNPLLFTIAAYSILRGNVTIGQVLSMIFYIDIAGESINQLTGLGKQYQTVRTCVTRIASLLTAPNEQITSTALKPVEEEPVFDVKEVSFAYLEDNVLSGISFQIKKGDKVAILGKSGSGKSTLFKLLNGLYAPSSGSISYKGQDIATLSIDDLRKNISVVPQEAFVFSDTIYNNILIAKPEAAAYEVKNACRLAKLHDFIETLENGYDTVLNNVVVSLSNGQLQRINLARAFLRDTDVWLFDEPTSALDIKARDTIMEYISIGAGDKTVLCIIHEPELMSWFDMCILLEEGHIRRIERRLERGTIYD